MAYAILRVQRDRPRGGPVPQRRMVRSPDQHGRVRRNVKRLPHHKVGRLTKFDEHCVDLLRERTAVIPHAPLARTPGSRARKR